MSSRPLNVTELTEFAKFAEKYAFQRTKQDYSNQIDAIWEAISTVIAGVSFSAQSAMLFLNKINDTTRGVSKNLVTIFPYLCINRSLSLPQFY